MKFTKLFIFLIGLAMLSACEPAANNNKNTNITNTNTSNSNSNTSTTQNLTVVPRPQKVADMMKERGEQDVAKPTLKFIEPKEGATVNSSDVKIKLEIGGELKGYKPMKDPATGMGNHIHVILDNQPYEAYYNLEEEFELKNVSDGEHTLRVFPSRPWHESYKDEGAFQMVRFTVKDGGADANKATTTNSGQQMSNANSNSAAPPEGKEMKESTGAAVDIKKPLLTYSRPKGEYKGADAEAIMLDFWLTNAKLSGDGGDYKVRYTIDGGVQKLLEKWEPIWLSGWSNGTHKVKLELLDKDGNLVENGVYNSTEREITVAK